MDQTFIIKRVKIDLVGLRGFFGGIAIPRVTPGKNQLSSSAPYPTLSIDHASHHGIDKSLGVTNT